MAWKVGLKQTVAFFPDGFVEEERALEVFVRGSVPFEVERRERGDHERQDFEDELVWQ